jgi:hypothetical protein
MPRGLLRARRPSDGSSSPSVPVLYNSRVKLRGVHDRRDWGVTGSARVRWIYSLVSRPSSHRPFSDFEGPGHYMPPKPRRSPLHRGERFGFFFNKNFRPRIGRDYPLNLSISISGGKEIKRDSSSSGERKRMSPKPNPASFRRREMWRMGGGALSKLTSVKVPVNGARPRAGARPVFPRFVARVAVSPGSRVA